MWLIITIVNNIAYAANGATLYAKGAIASSVFVASCSVCIFASQISAISRNFNPLSVNSV
ncbi:hypothetical protein CXF83_13025 [Shewanella sp. Choline-02u-19]|nr:hypothetical protein CXF82_09590 [Shewanella sp. GutDb-MelDb]PKH56349.1 hypothetical protein CXF84_13695 [Shewanella sp. Bg11-22]PKI27557.1 hypothetical protein CXF83_13025 [Shewanella sp. Choline-02u-19]